MPWLAFAIPVALPARDRDHSLVNLMLGCCVQLVTRLAASRSQRELVGFVLDVIESKELATC